VDCIYILPARNGFGDFAIFASFGQVPLMYDDNLPCVNCLLTAWSWQLTRHTGYTYLLNDTLAQTQIATSDEERRI
jgi:hypothetical protein